MEKDNKRELDTTQVTVGEINRVLDHTQTTVGELAHNEWLMSQPACPFCGKEAGYDYDKGEEANEEMGWAGMPHWLGCKIWDCPGHHDLWSTTKEEASARWSKRA